LNHACSGLHGCHVNEDKWDTPDGHLSWQGLFGAKSHHGDPFDLAFQHPTNAIRHSLRIAVRGTYQNLVSVFDGYIFEALNQFWKERVRNLRDN
ncbi:MAG TPA: hypothetical protein VJU82_07270, partial [Acidobacteriaceae bacterium]|nr:hypothetical protein [Acidobacteriaceae bacterium]